MSKFRFNTPQQLVRNLARIDSIVLNPVAQTVEIGVSFGNDTGGTFAETHRDVYYMQAPLPGAVVTIMRSLVTRAFNFLQAQGVIPAGTEEA